MSKTKTLNVLHSLVVFLLLGACAYNLRSNIQLYKVIARTFSVTTSNELVPPGMVFCLSKDTKYDFTIEIYNEVVERNRYLEAIPADSNKLSSLRGLVVRCWVLSPPIGSNRALIKNPP